MLPNVFLSYSKKTPTPTMELADYLSGRGFSVWWDTNLTAGQDFGAVIEGQLNAADVIIVIWTPESVKSLWVKSEASYAERAKKLVTVKTQDVKFDQIPKPFDMYHTELVDNYDEIINAIYEVKGFSKDLLEAGQAGVAVQSDAYKRWLRVERSLDARDYEDYIEVFAGAPEVFEAKLHKRQLEDWEALNKADLTEVLMFESREIFPALASHVAKTREELERYDVKEEVCVPALGFGDNQATQASVVQWLKKPGDLVSVDEAVVELETEKLTMEIPSPCDGIMVDVFAAEGDTVEVGMLLASIGRRA